MKPPRKTKRKRLRTTPDGLRNICAGFIRSTKSWRRLEANITPSHQGKNDSGRRLKLLATELVKEQFQFAICGGVAASIYRRTPRFTNDLDLAVVVPGAQGADLERNLAIEFLQRLGYKTSLGWFPGATHTDARVIFAVIGKTQGFVPSIDLLLPSLAWVRDAVLRAQDNLIDYGFAKLATIKPEDLIISKAYVLSIDPARPDDRRDISEILSNDVIADQDYLQQALKRLQISI
jgi:hypothetical protein